MFFFYFTIYDHHVQGYLTNQVIERISINRKFLLGHATSTSCPNTSQQNDYSRENECLRAHPYTCGICLFKFTNRYNLTIHIRRKHTKEKPFKCTYCARDLLLKVILQYMCEYILAKTHIHVICAENVSNQIVRCVNIVEGVVTL